MNDSTPPFLRCLGAFAILVAAILGAVASATAAKFSTSLLKPEIRFDTSRPFAQLSDQEKKERGYHMIINNLTEKIEDLHYDLKKKDFIARITSDPKISWLTYLGSFLVMSSYFVEWRVKEKKGESGSRR